MKKMIQTAAHHALRHSSRKPSARGLLLDFDMEPSPRAILYADPEPLTSDE